MLAGAVRWKAARRWLTKRLVITTLTAAELIVVVDALRAQFAALVGAEPAGEPILPPSQHTRLVIGAIFLAIFCVILGFALVWSRRLPAKGRSYAATQLLLFFPAAFEVVVHIYDEPLQTLLVMLMPLACLALQRQLEPMSMTS